MAKPLEISEHNRIMIEWQRTKKYIPGMCQREDVSG